MGDIIEIKDEEVFPADCILLKTAKADGQVYVETAALDGERNLKPLLVPIEIQNSFAELFSCDQQSDKQAVGNLGSHAKTPRVEFRVMEPMKDLYTFEGQAKIQKQDYSADNGGIVESVKIDVNQFLHSGAVLKNSQRVLCMVVQTGPQTKLSMNLTKYRIK